MKILAIAFFLLSVLCAYSAVYHELWLEAKEIANLNDMCSATSCSSDKGKVEKHTDEKGRVWWYFYDKTPEGYTYQGKSPRFVPPSNPYFGKITMKRFGHWVVEIEWEQVKP